MKNKEHSCSQPLTDILAGICELEEDFSVSAKGDNNRIEKATDNGSLAGGICLMAYKERSL